MNKSDDLISRQDIKYHTQLEAMGNGQYEEVEVAYKNDIESLPSADRPTGKWEQVDSLADRLCSICGYGVWDFEAEEYNFCPNCGARMYKGGENK